MHLRVFYALKLTYLLSNPVQRNCSAELHQRPETEVIHGGDALRP